MPDLRSCLSHRQSGVALAIVLWFLAAMSLLVAGIVYQGRVDVQLAQTHVARAKAAAAGDGAVQMMLARFLSVAQNTADNNRGANKVQPSLSDEFLLGDTRVAVTMVPASGLVDLFNTPPQVLAALFAFRTELTAAQAQQLADNVVELRSPVARQKLLGEQQTAPLSTPEDLLRIPGFSRAMLDALADDVRAVSGGQSRLSWAAAPVGLVEALRSTDPQRAATLLERIGGASDENLFNARSEKLFRVDAIVDYGGQHWLRRRWVELSPGAGSDLPWRIVRTEAPRALAKLTSIKGG